MVAPQVPVQHVWEPEISPKLQTCLSLFPTARPAQRKMGKHPSMGVVPFQEQKVAAELAVSAWHKEL